MKVKFFIDYQTNFGEEMMLNIMPHGDAAQKSQHAMTTVNGKTWFCEMNFADKDCDFIDYYYSVNREGYELRHEWLVAPHRLELVAPRGSRYTVYDHWIDIPEDSYLYSSAFTDCVASRPLQMSKKVEYAQTVRIKVRAPQLRQGEKLAIVGEGATLGNWSVINPVHMVEHSHNEWVASIDASKLDTRLFTFKFVSLDATDNEPYPLWEEGENRTIVLPDMKKGDVLVYELDPAYFALHPYKLAGTVVPIFSLKTEGSFGVGDFGDLKNMVDWVASTHQRALQVLPINDTTITKTWVDSYPYNSISIYALHPQYTDLRQLPQLKDKKRQKYFDKLQKELNDLPQIDYERVNAAKHEFLHEVFAQEGAEMMKSEAFKTFFKNNEHWLVPYAAFCHYRDQYGTATFSEWPEHRSFDDKTRAAMANPRTKIYKEVAYWYFVQFILDQQMRGAHEYARSKGVILKGDIPIGISPDGVEAWVEPKYFNLNGQAGAPPDAFSANGQNWGFPTYNWDEMLKDGCSWWVKRFTKMAEYFDAYRIDHVLGFFRIWEIPIEAVYGLLGQFSPSQGMSREEIEGYGLHFQDYFTRPFIAHWVVNRIFGHLADKVRSEYLDHLHNDIYQLKEEYNTQRKIEAAFRGKDSDDDKWIRDGLMALVSDVLFLPDRKNPNLFHPRIAVQHDFIYEALYDSDKAAFNRLYNDYFYRRNNEFWYHEAMKKLPKLVQATRMLVCAEDLGMVPDCVAWVMNELRILSLEIQSMPKDDKLRFGNLYANPYRSVSTISTHDMPTLRQWWDEDWDTTQAYFNEVLHREGPAPHPLPDWLASDIVRNHLNCPSMLCLLSLQDWLSIDESLRLPDANAERINIPANPRHYWRYRMHMTIEQLMNSSDFNNKVKIFISQSGRK